MVDAPELVYRSRAFAVVGWAMLAVVVLAVVTVFIDRPAPAGLWVTCAVLGGAAVAWLVTRCYIVPRVVSGADGVRVVNPFKTTRIRWRDIERFEARPMLRVVRSRRHPCDGVGRPGGHDVPAGRPHGPGGAGGGGVDPPTRRHVSPSAPAV